MPTSQLQCIRADSHDQIFGPDIFSCIVSAHKNVDLRSGLTVLVFHKFDVTDSRWWRKYLTWGGGHDGPPKCFWLLCSNASEEEAETWWLLISISGASKRFFGSLGYLVLAEQRVCQGVLEIFWSYVSVNSKPDHPPGPTGKCFERANSPPPQHREDAKPRQKNGAKAPPRGNYFQKSSRKPQNMRQISRKTVLKC